LVPTYGLLEDRRTYVVILDSMLPCVCSVTDHVFFVLFSDPYARVVFGTQSQVTEILTSTICPTWDQTLIFENVQIYGSIDKVARHPPEVIIELFDKDPVVSQSLTCNMAFFFPPCPVRQKTNAWSLVSQHWSHHVTFLISVTWRNKWRLRCWISSGSCHATLLCNDVTCWRCLFKYSVVFRKPLSGHSSCVKESKVTGSPSADWDSKRCYRLG